MPKSLDFAASGNKRYVFDIETDGFLEDFTTIHCLVLLDMDTQALHTFGPFQIEAGLRLLQDADLIVGHNIIKFDLPVIRKLYPDFHPKGTIRDTLVMSRLIYADLKDRDFGYRHKRPDFLAKMIGKHALEAWGHRLDMKKGSFRGPWEQWTEEMQGRAHYLPALAKADLQALQRAGHHAGA